MNCRHRIKRAKYIRLYCSGRARTGSGFSASRNYSAIISIGYHQAPCIRVTFGRKDVSSNAPFDPPVISGHKRSKTGLADPSISTTSGKSKPTPAFSRRIQSLQLPHISCDLPSSTARRPARYYTRIHRTSSLLLHSIKIAFLVGVMSRRASIAALCV